ncbi:hypothetical protein mRhiFer1_008817 [Rhinolophus ferrumequinum]|uniref:Ferritin n=1 Tax=Rhinolophus ferrumequinum TaxID=59479 RepID=A0A7J8AFG4_RHIFE|nr:hypothetical protein mRhiFer1_008817 [Rhinolophus ferrumequinum]
MEAQLQRVISEDCRLAINQVASFQLHVSDAYLSMRPDLDNWGTGIQALESALELENKLTKLLQDLKTLASANSETDLLRFMGKYLDKQKRNIGYLEHQLLYHRKVEKQAQEEDTFKKPAEVSGKET